MMRKILIRGFLTGMYLLLFMGCASREIVKSDSEDKPATAKFDSEIIYISADKEIGELQRAYANKQFDWMYSKLKGYFRVGNTQFLSDVIHDSPGMTLRMLAVAVLFDDSDLFGLIYEVGFVSESDEATKRLSVAFKKTYGDCGVNFQQAMRSYFVNRKVDDIDFGRIGDSRCRNSIKLVF